MTGTTWLLLALVGNVVKVGAVFLPTPPNNFILFLHSSGPCFSSSYILKSNTVVAVGHFVIVRKIVLNDDQLHLHQVPTLRLVPC